jgi:1,4-alpha-glucan branching enzyme
MKPRGELAIVLHTHMPYVEGFGTWPFGEEWLWEAIATSYVPLLDVLGRAPVTLSLTPVLCDQLEAPGALERCVRFIEEIRPESHRLDIEAARAEGRRHDVIELERSAREYADVAVRLRELSGGLLAALGQHASWTSSATHAILPLLATDSGVTLQLETGIASHRRRFGDWSGGLWLPECAYAPWLDELLGAAGVRHACIELDRGLAPIATAAGLVLWPIDREAMSLAWSDHGYPSAGVYRDYHRRTEHDHRVWGNDGQSYDHAAAVELTTTHARDFVTRVSERVSAGGVCVCAFDTELLGHWWYEGVAWLSSVIDVANELGLELITLDEALERHEPAPAGGALPVTSWGAGGDLRTWSGPAVAELAWQARTAELCAVRYADSIAERALRELLALQSSDWAFLATAGTAGPYPRERAAAHAEAFRSALRSGVDDPAVRNLSPELVGWRGGG